MVLKNYPIIQQLSDNDCGVAAVQSILLYYGKHEKYSELKEQLGLTEDGVGPNKVKECLGHHGIEYIPSHPSLEDIRRNISDGHPVLVLIQNDRDIGVHWTETWDHGHWTSVIGFTKRSLVLADPWTGKELRLFDKDFKVRWHDVGYEQYAILLRGEGGI